MHQLFSVPAGQTLADTIRRMHDGALAEIFGRTILTRAYGYLDAIEDLDIRSGTGSAEIYGTEPYSVNIEYRLGDVFGGCTCPYEGACKHLAALLIHLREEQEAVGLNDLNVIAEASGRPASPANSAFDFDAYLEKLSATELRGLVRQFAPEAFRRALALQHAAPAARRKIGDAAIQRVRGLLKKAHEYGPDDFEAALLKPLESLRALWLSETDQVLDVLREVIAGIDEAQGEGYLYDDYSDGVFDGTELGSYLAAHPEDKLLTPLKGMCEAFWECEFDFCQNFPPDALTAFSEGQCRAAAPFFLKTEAVVLLEDRHQRVVWERLQPVLKPAERLKFLKKLVNNTFFALLLVDELEARGDGEAAIRELEKTMPVRPPTPNPFFSTYRTDGKRFERRIELENRYRAGRETEQWAARYVREIPAAQSLQFAVQHAPKQQAALEADLNKTNVEAFARYLEDQRRLDEVLALFRLSTGAPAFSSQYEFFKRHKKTYPAPAKKIFLQHLYEQLEPTGERHYRAVAEALTQLKALETPDDFQARMADIRAQYKRWRLLMDILSAAGI